MMYTFYWNHNSYIMSVKNCSNVSKELSKCINPDEIAHMKEYYPGYRYSEDDEMGGKGINYHKDIIILCLEHAEVYSKKGVNQYIKLLKQEDI